jgi:hypothetical protein
MGQPKMGNEFEPLPPDLAKQLADLENQRGKLWEQMLQGLATMYSFGALAHMDERTKLALDEELEDLVENWMEADHDASSENPLRAETELQQLLAEYHRQGELMLNIEDEAIQRRTRDGGL